MESKTDIFVKKARDIHGNRYDYSLVEYHTVKTKVKIRCLTHGVFEQIPNNHLSGRGCPVCSGKTSTLKTFLDTSRSMHGDRYDYSLVEYEKTSIPVTIICPIHGEFDQKPSCHMAGHGCQKCAKRDRWTLDKFLISAERVHGDRYDYSAIDEVTHAKQKVTITCRVHGPFQQSVTNHIALKHNCPKCRSNYGGGSYSDSLFKRFPDRKDIPAMLYVMRFTNSDEVFLKVGITTLSIERRMAPLKSETHSEYTIEEVITHRCSLFDAFTIEQKILDELKEHSYSPMRHFCGSTECLVDTQCVIDFIAESV